MKSNFLFLALLFSVLSYGQPGSLDSSFNTKGFGISKFNNFNSAFGHVVVTQNNKILALGGVRPATNNHDILVARYNADGSSDNSFGNGGYVNHEISGPNSHDLTAYMILQSDGNILVAGTNMPNPGDGIVNSYIIRLKANGTLDSTLNGNGKIVLQNAYPGGLALQPDQKIVFSATRFDSTVIFRYNKDGSPDNTFNGNGRLIKNLATNQFEIYSRIVIRPDGKINLSGRVASSGSQNASVIAQVNANGTYDSSFDFDGVMYPSTGQNAFSEAIEDIAIQEDGKIIIGGTSQFQVTSSSYRTNNFMFRLSQTGSRDSTFSNDGLAIFETAPDLNHFLQNLVIQPDGKIIVGGQASAIPNGSMTRILIYRYQTNGLLDSSFGNSGVVNTNLGLSGMLTNGIALHGQRIYVSGQRTTAIYDSAFIVVYKAGICGAVKPEISLSVPQLLCSGSIVTMYSSVQNNNQWFKDGVAIPGATNSIYATGGTGSYKVVSGTQSCNASSNPIILSSVQIPSAPIITVSGNILTSSANSGNQWYKDGIAIAGANWTTFSATQFGSYTVTTTQNGCTSSPSIAINYTPTSLAPPLQSINLRIGPNPARTEINISISGSLNLMEIQLFDISGQLVMARQFTNSLNVDISSRPKGMYLLRVTDLRTARSIQRSVLKL